MKMKTPFKHLLVLILGVSLLSSSIVFAEETTTPVDTGAGTKPETAPADTGTKPDATPVDTGTKPDTKPNDTGTKPETPPVDDAKKCDEQMWKFKDAFIDIQKGMLKKKDNEKSTAEKIEDALNEEYQNSLRKVGKLYQSIGTEVSTAGYSGEYQANTKLIEFMKAVTAGSTDAAKMEELNKLGVQEILKELQTASEKKFNDTNKNAVITNNDIYLLKKLLVHAQDKSLQKIDPATTQENMPKKADPLARLIQSLKDAKIVKYSHISITKVDSESIIPKTVSDDLARMREWAKNTKEIKGCQEKIYHNQVLRDTLQVCNMAAFMDVFNQETFNPIEDILNFMTSNLRTNLDENKINQTIKDAFTDLGTVNCLPVANADGTQKIFLQNFDPGVLTKEPKDPKDTTEINKMMKNFACFSDKDKKTTVECSDKLSFQNDANRGLEVKSSDNKIFLSVLITPIDPIVPKEPTKSYQGCDGLSFLASKEESDCLKKIEEADTTKREYKWNKSNNKCEAINAKACELEKSYGDIPNIWDENTKTCNALDKKKAQNKCEESVDKIKIWNTTDNLCEEATDKNCKDRLEKDLNVPYVWNKDTCERPSNDVLKTECEKNDNKKWNGEQCIDAEVACNEANDTWLEKNGSDGGYSSSTNKGKWEWDDENKVCKDLLPKKSKPKDDDYEPYEDTNPKTLPARFKPVNVPTRQMYLLPGMQ